MSDETTTPNVTGQVAGASDGADTGDNDGEDDADGDDARIIFESQDALDEMVERRLRRDRRERKAKKAVSEAGDKVEGQDDTPPARDDSEIMARVAKAQQVAVQGNALVAATEAGLTGEHARAAAKLADLDLAIVITESGDVDADAVKDAIADAVKAYPFLKTSSTPAPKPEPKPGLGGTTPKPDGDKPTGAVTAEEFENMDYFERVALYTRDPQTYNALMGT